MYSISSIRHCHWGPLPSCHPQYSMGHAVCSSGKQDPPRLHAHSLVAQTLVTGIYRCSGGNPVLWVAAPTAFGALPALPPTRTCADGIRPSGRGQSPYPSPLPHPVLLWWSTAALSPFPRTSLSNILLRILPPCPHHQRAVHLLIKQCPFRMGRRANTAGTRNAPVAAALSFLSGRDLPFHPSGAHPQRDG